MAVAYAAVRLASQRGVTLPADLRLWALAGGRPAGAAAQAVVSDGVTRDVGGGGEHTPVSTDPPDDTWPRRDGDEERPHGGAELAETLEAATSAEQRRSAGLHVTPSWLADHLVGLALSHGGSDPARPESADRRGGALGHGGHRPARDQSADGQGHGSAQGDAGDEWLPIACDPACGGGVFLVAVAEALHRRGVDRTQIVEELLWGADIDPVGLAAAEAALAIWSGGEVPPPGRLVVGDPLRDGAGIWPDRPRGGFGLVVGNPPFQNQLERTTARPRADRDRLRARFGGVLRAYTDTAWLFLLLACELAQPGGRAVLVQPESVMAARDAAAVRAAVDRKARIADLWVDDRQVFTARVRVCAPVLEIDSADADSSMPSGPRAWQDLLADATGIPRIALSATAGRLGDRATIVAGFRDEYYGLIPLVCDASPPGGRSLAPLVTVGAVDWGRSAWGRRPLRFAKRRWAEPAVDLARLDARGSPAARRWVARTLVPKIVVATQTKVLELAVDEQGAWVPSVPVISVVPERSDDLWRLAAALASPAATAWLARRTPGVGLHRGALKVSRRDLAELPLPPNPGAWDAAAAALRNLVAVHDPGAFDRFVAAAAAAYGSAPALVEWWRGRLDATR